MKYAINYVLGRDTRVIALDAVNPDEAYAAARDALYRARLYSASLQGTCRPASQDDLDAGYICPSCRSMDLTPDLCEHES